MFLLNFGMIFSYCLFCPFVYLAEFIFLCNKHFRNNRKKLFIIVLFTLILPGILGTSYILLKHIKGITNAFAMEGYVYKNIWSNFLLFIPFIGYKLYHEVKNKEVHIESLMFLFEIAFIVILSVLLKLEKCSEYYFYKNWYALWLIACFMNIKGINCCD